MGILPMFYGQDARATTVETHYSRIYTLSSGEGFMYVLGLIFQTGNTNLEILG